MLWKLSLWHHKYWITYLCTYHTYHGIQKQQGVPNFEEKKWTADKKSLRIFSRLLHNCENLFHFHLDLFLLKLPRLLTELSSYCTQWCHLDDCAYLRNRYVKSSRNRARSLHGRFEIVLENAAKMALKSRVSVNVGGERNASQSK